MPAGAPGPGIRRRVERIDLGVGQPSIAIITLASQVEGPTVVVTANVHGDEVTGIAAVHDLDRRLVSVLRRGNVVLAPSLNPDGLEQQSRVQPSDGVDLNRVFPGDPTASASGAARIAGRVWLGLHRHSPDAVIDLHADSALSIPYAIVDRSVRLEGPARQKMDRALEGLAEASGLTVLREYPDELYRRFRLDQSLAGAMVNHAKVPAITLEVGPRRAVAPKAVLVMVEAVMRIFGYLKLVDEAPSSSHPRRLGGPWRRSSAPKVGATGLFVASRAPGESFSRGDVLGEVRNLQGTAIEIVRATADGLVVSWGENAWVTARSVPGTIGLVDG